jgi:hypothetical protein
MKKNINLSLACLGFVLAIFVNTEIAFANGNNSIPPDMGCNGKNGICGKTAGGTTLYGDCGCSN